jgi:hypothetical protein
VHVRTRLLSFSRVKLSLKCLGLGSRCCGGQLAGHVINRPARPLRSVKTLSHRALGNLKLSQQHPSRHTQLELQWDG